MLKEDKYVGQNVRLTNFASKFAAIKIKMKVSIKYKLNENEKVI